MNFTQGNTQDQDQVDLYLLSCKEGTTNDVRWDVMGSGVNMYQTREGDIGRPCGSSCQSTPVEWPLETMDKRALHSLLVFQRPLQVTGCTAFFLAAG